MRDAKGEKMFSVEKSGREYWQAENGVMEKPEARPPALDGFGATCFEQR